MTRLRAAGLGALALMLVMMSCGGTPKPAAHKPSPGATPCPVAAAPGVWVRGCVILNDGDNLDLDGGQVDVQSYDLALANGGLTVAPGTVAAYQGVRDFESVSPSDIAGANLGDAGYEVSQLQKGGVLEVRTGQGRPSKVRFDSVSGKVVHLSFFTYSSFAQVPSSAPTPTPFHTTPTPTPTHSTSPSSTPKPP